ncbi:hypothetical protein ACFFIX_05070 [Metabacillus herbersteinensis]|uniref:Protein-export membrane protein SecG n=1 Tax=Metabacillus herbersteinensis TaxID=283816 RepID=A0ABV6GAX4_9BACI
MELAIILVLIIALAALIGTFLAAGQGDKDYSSSTKSNLSRLSIIYLVLAIVLFVGIALYLIL